MTYDILGSDADIDHSMYSSDYICIHIMISNDILKLTMNDTMNDTYTPDYSH